MQLVLTINGHDIHKITVMNKKDIPALTFHLKRRHADKIAASHTWCIYLYRSSKMNYGAFAQHASLNPKPETRNLFIQKLSKKRTNA